MKRIILKYIFALILSTVLWNIIISNCIYNQTSEINDNVIGSHKKPNTIIVSGFEGYSRFITDNYGFNNDYIEPVNNKNSFRILCLGDSLTEAEQVFRKDNYISLLENKFKSANHNVKVINLGRSGRAMPDYLSYADGYKETFKPDYYIIQFTIDDFTNDAININKENSITTTENGFKIIQKNGNQSILQKLKPLKDKSGWFKSIIGYSGIHLSKLFLQKSLSSEKISPQNASPVYKKVSASNTKINTKSMIEWQIQELLKSYGNSFTLLYTSSIPYIINNNTVVCNESSIENKQYIINLCNKYNIPIIDTTKEFVLLYKNDNKFPYGFNNTKPGIGHLNRTGHKIIAELLYKSLCKSLKFKSVTPKSPT